MPLLKNQIENLCQMQLLLELFSEEDYLLSKESDFYKHIDFQLIR
jgi:hypothetical protein